MATPYMRDILNFGSYKTLAKTRYVNDKQITDHYAIIPTGQGLNALNTVSSTAKGVYDLIVRRFLSIFYPPAVYQKVAIVIKKIKEESFFSSFKVLAEEGYLKVARHSEEKLLRQPQKIAMIMETVRIITMIQMTRRGSNSSDPKAWTPDCSKWSSH